MHNKINVTIAEQYAGGNVAILINGINDVLQNVFMQAIIDGFKQLDLYKADYQGLLAWARLLNFDVRPAILDVDLDTEQLRKVLILLQQKRNIQNTIDNIKSLLIDTLKKDVALVDTADQNFRLIFDFQGLPWLAKLIKQYDIIPRPAGVGFISQNDGWHNIGFKSTELTYDDELSMRLTPWQNKRITNFFNGQFKGARTEGFKRDRWNPKTYEPKGDDNFI